MKVYRIAFPFVVQDWAAITNWRQAQLLIDNSGQAEEEEEERRNSMWDGFSPFLYKYLHTPS